jgi:glycosyltransferase involved in cell wall biosynthesis
VSAPRELLLVAPDLFDREGGIARIARATALACQQVCAERGWRLTALSLLDRGAARDERYLPASADYLGFDGKRLAFARAVLSRALRRSHAGTIFCHVNFASLGLLYPLRRSGLLREYVVVAHGVDVGNSLPVHRRYALRCAREVWPVSEYTGRLVRDLQGVPPLRIRPMHNCLDPLWPVVVQANPTESAGYLLCVSRLARSDRYKGIDDLIAAMGIVAGRLRNLRLIVVGDGDDAAHLRGIAGDGAAAGQVEFRGAVDDVELRRLYADCTVFAMPSGKEGFGLAFLEAMAHGKPVIAADSAGTPEVVLHGETGILVPYGDRERLAEAIVALAGDPVRARAMGERGRERVRQHFSYQRYLKDIRAALSRLWVSSAENRASSAGAA